MSRNSIDALAKVSSTSSRTDDAFPPQISILLSRCLVVDSVIDARSAHRAITSVTSTNTRFEVAARGRLNSVTIPEFDGDGPL